MIRTDIEIPKNIKYLGEIRNIELPYGTFDRFELPNGILNKDVPNCGATTLALEDNHKTIICIVQGIICYRTKVNSTPMFCW